jgi:hypothetical protein
MRNVQPSNRTPLQSELSVTKRIIEGYHLLDRPSIAYAKPPCYAIGKVPALIYLCQLDLNLRLDLVDEAG